MANSPRADINTWLTTICQVKFRVPSLLFLLEFNFHKITTGKDRKWDLYYLTFLLSSELRFPIPFCILVGIPDQVVLPAP